MAPPPVPNITAFDAEPDDAVDLVVTDPRRQRWILVSMCVALVAVIASVSGLNVAQQDLAIDLGASQSTLLWIINGYTMALAALLMPIGAIGDRWGRKPVLLTGLVVFAAANIVAAVAPTAAVMLVARVVAGAGAAMIMPVTLSVITSSFPVDQRARAVGVWAGFAGAGGILGLFFSSVMIDYFTWPWLFAMPVALALAAFAISMRVVGNSREDHGGRFDTIGSVLSAVAIGGLVLGIHEGPEAGWTNWLTLTGLVAGAVALAAFAAWEHRQVHPLFDIRLFRDRGLAAGSVSLLIVFAVMFGLFLVLVQYLQAVLGYSALRSAAGLLPMAALMMPLSSIAPVVVGRIGTRRTLVLGIALFGTGLALMASLASAEGGYLSVLPGLLVLASGMGLTMTPATTAITETLPPEKQGVASALNDTVREVGGAVGIALIGSVLNSGYRSNVSATADGLPPELADPVRDGIGGALAVAGQLGDDGAVVATAARDAFVEGWRTSMWVGVVLAAVAVAYVVLRGPRTVVDVDADVDAHVDPLLGDRDIDARTDPVLAREPAYAAD
jgi:EmrB/QacA subfamily drug resistance transporter